MKFPQTQSSPFAMGGGLDLVTPALALPPGKVFDAQNYEPEISGGYRRMDGYERSDGRPSPTSANYWVMGMAPLGPVAIGATMTGGTSGATGRVLGTTASMVVLGRVTGTFTIGENLLVAAVIVATSTSQAALNGSPDPSSDADYKLLAANDYRADIQMVPGSGRIRGVVLYNDVVYAFRDNLAGTAGDIYRQTSGGWVKVAFGTEIQFSSSTGGATPIVAGDVIGNAAAPTKTATVVAVLLRTGTWGTDAVGTLVIAPILGTFANADPIYVGATQKAAATTAATAITRLPGGRLDHVVDNFTGSVNTRKVYGADGVNLAFEFDGAVYVPIRTGMAVDTPAHCMVHSNYLFLSFQGSVQYSGIGNPYAWTTILGAGEITTGFPVTGFIPQTGNGAGGSLGIFTSGKTFILYGATAATFKMVPSTFDLGYSAWTAQAVGNDSFGLTGRGVQKLMTTLNYGDFQYASITQLIQPLITRKRGMEIASNSLKTRNQYRLYFNDGSAIVIGLTGDKVSGILPLDYGRVVRCIVTGPLSTGEEVTYFGSDDGYVYRDNIGTSLDGANIEAWIRPVFNDLKSPMLRKRFRTASFQVRTEGYGRVNISYDLGYGNPDEKPSAPSPDTVLVGAGGYWDQFIWDQFTWDAPVVADLRTSLDGTERNISFLFYSNRAQDKSHTVQACVLMFTPQRQERG